MKTFWDDFWKSGDEWRSRGEQLIVDGDWNNEIYESDIRTEFKIRNNILAITGRHKKMTPPINNKSNKPIDKIFVSGGVNVIKSGFLHHDINEGDHCPIWIEVSKECMLGINPPQISSFDARKLRT